MRKTFLLIFLLFSIFLFSQGDKNNAFFLLPKLEIKDLVKKIKPSKNYKNWALVYYDFKSNKILFQKGKKKLSPTRSESDYYGFFPCIPGGCYSYFYAIDKNNQEKYITREKDIINFFGEVDTVEEALFIAMLNGYGIDENNKSGNIYKELNDEFILHLSKISYTAHKREAFIITIKKTGEFNAKSDGVYHYDPNVRIDI